MTRKFTDAEVLAILRMLRETDCGYCLDGYDVGEGGPCPECGALQNAGSGDALASARTEETP